MDPRLCNACAGCFTILTISLTHYQISKGLILKSILKVVARIADPRNFAASSCLMYGVLLVMDSYCQVDNFQPVFVTKSMKYPR